MPLRTLLLAAILASAAPAFAQQAPYAGQQARGVAQLSDQEAADILAGKGAGLAKSAELNGYPGPRHVLDMAKDLALTSQQSASVQAVFDAMERDAKAAGQRYVDSERRLDAAFRSGAATEPEIARLDREAGAAWADLRHAHLAAHLETRSLLTPHQLMLYSQLRGYAGGQAQQHQHH